MAVPVGVVTSAYGAVPDYPCPVTRFYELTDKPDPKPAGWDAFIEMVFVKKFFTKRIRGSKDAHTARSVQSRVPGSLRPRRTKP